MSSSGSVANINVEPSSPSKSPVDLPRLTQQNLLAVNPGDERNDTDLSRDSQYGDEYDEEDDSPKTFFFQGQHIPIVREKKKVVKRRPRLMSQVTINPETVVQKKGSSNFLDKLGALNEKIKSYQVYVNSREPVYLWKKSSVESPQGNTIAQSNANNSPGRTLQAENDEKSTHKKSPSQKQRFILRPQSSQNQYSQS